MADTIIQTIVNKNGDTILPRTRISAITLDDGTTNLADHLVTFTEGFPTDLQAINANTLDGHDSSYFSIDGHTHTESEITDLDKYTQAETDQAIADAISALVDSSPEALNTLNELAAALSDDENFATTVTEALAGKANNSTITLTSLIAANWSSNVYTLTVSGVTSTSVNEIYPTIDITLTQLEALGGAMLVETGQSANTIILTAYGDIPTIDIPIRVVIRGDL